jgi:outer membrane protein assembly factor BamB
LSCLLAAAVLCGCKSKETKPSGPETLPAEGFIESWRNPLDLQGDDLSRLYLINNTIFAYSEKNTVYVLDSKGGDLKHIDPLGGTPGEVRRPLPLDNRILYPRRSSLAVFTNTGRDLGSLDLEHSIRSPVVGAGKFVYCGLDYTQGGRLAQIDLTRQYHNIVWEVHTGAGVSAAPVIYQETIYAGTEEGNVLALNKGRDLVWGLPNGVFKTEAPITADLVADDYGLYVASTDTKLYVLDRGSGKIRWRYFAGAPLDTPPVATKDMVYQYVKGAGVVAIDKINGEFDRKPRWIASNGRQFLSEDEKNVYVRGSDNHILAIDKKTGEAKFRNRRKDLVHFATNTTDSLIYAATKDGLVIAVKPVTTPGAVGTVVKADEMWEQLASAD